MKINLIRAETRKQIDIGPGVIGARGFAVDHSGFHLFTFNMLHVYLTIFYGTQTYLFSNSLLVISILKGKHGRIVALITYETYIVTII